MDEQERKPVRGPGKKARKVQVTIRLDAKVIAYLREVADQRTQWRETPTRYGWQSVAGEALEYWVKMHKKIAAYPRNVW